MRWLDSITYSVDMNLGRHLETVRARIEEVQKEQQAAGGAAGTQLNFGGVRKAQ